MTYEAQTLTRRHEVVHWNADRTPAPHLTSSGLTLMSLLLFVACEEPHSPSNLAHVEGPSLRIQDGAHNDGNPGFYFLPPLVQNPRATGDFDGSLLHFLSVEICEWTGADCVHPVVARFTSEEGTGGQVIRVRGGNRSDENDHEEDDEDDNGDSGHDKRHYVVKWKTMRSDLAPSKTYRIRVLAAGTELGHADVDVVVKNKELRNVNTNEYIALKEGKTLVIKFRVEQGTVFIVGAEGGGVSTPDGAVTLDIPPGALSAGTGITITPQPVISPDIALVPGTVFEFGPDGTTFNAPAELTITYDPAAVPSQVFESSLRLFHESGSGWESVPGSSADVNGHTVTGSISGFSDYAVIGTEVQIAPQGTFLADQYLISGERIAWLDMRDVDFGGCPSIPPPGQCFWDIFVFDAVSGVEERVTPSGAYPIARGNRLAFSGDRIAWPDNRSAPIPNALTAEEIYILDLTTGVETRAAGHARGDALGLHRSLVSFGNRLAWLEHRQMGLTIVVLDLATGVQAPYSTSLSAPGVITPGDNLVMSDQRVAWRVQQSLFTLDLATGIETPIPTGGGTVSSPAISGNRIVWAELRNGNADIYMFDVSTNTETRITTDATTQTAPDISGDRIVWVDFRNAGGDPANSDIYTFDLASGIEGLISSDPSRQSRPRISGDRIVWSDARNGGVLVLFQIREQRPGSG